MRFLKNIFAFLLIPAIGAAGYVLSKYLLCLVGFAKSQYAPFWLGVVCYIIFQAAFYRPMRIYVFGHELSHAIVGILSGAKVKKFKVDKEFGSVVLTEDNVCIALAPYFFPIYTFAIIIIYIFLDWFVGIKSFYGYFLFLIGFSIAFHIVLTVYVLVTQQPDLKIYGVFFSFIVIFAVNVVMFTVIAALVFPKEVNFKEISFQIFVNIRNVYKSMYNGALEVWLVFQKTK
ncbi:MAG: hypothetical protein LBQ99_03545 [Endomicrobium sp.]|jgi:hypothetical protein|nr:hypothetical protein [Endomicrobium sp.]